MTQYCNRTRDCRADWYEAGCASAVRPSTTEVAMKLWLDDVRDPPDSTWTVARTAADAIGYLAVWALQGHEVEAISLDHDLGALPEDGIYARGTSEETGQLVANYIAAYGPFPNTRPIFIHSWNSAGAYRMAAVLGAGGYHNVTIRPYIISAADSRRGPGAQDVPGA